MGCSTARMLAFGLALTLPNMATAAPAKPTATKPAPPTLDKIVVASDGVDTKALLPEATMRRPDIAFSRGVAPRDAAKLTIEPGARRQTLTLTTLA